GIRDPFWPRHGNMKRNTAAIGMTDEMDLVIALIDEGDRSRRLIRKRESVLSAPCSAALTPVVLGHQHLVGGAECLGEAIPLAGARARAMQSYDLFASHYGAC